ncbi:MAG: hypothetical protein LDL44_04520 [Caenispirillum sp.]|nr:hypothetical protein [Caenispirillum sp.]
MSWTEDLRGLACTLHQRPPATPLSCKGLAVQVRRAAGAARASGLIGIADTADLLDEVATWFDGWAAYRPYPIMSAETRNNVAQALLLAAAQGERRSNVVALEPRRQAAGGVQ